MVTHESSAPLLSIVVIGFRMPEQLGNTLYSLSREYQALDEASNYEVIVVENHSSQTLAQSTIDSLGEEFQYFLREESGVSPAAAINYALSKVKGTFVCLMIDGARLLTPGVVANILHCVEMHSSPLVIVPGYTLGDKDKYEELGDSYSWQDDKDLLEQIDWRNNGYGLFDIAYFSQANHKGFFFTTMECNCLTVRKSELDKLGGADERFDLKGGGMLNLFLYRSLALLSNTKLFLLFGEGSFHQYHGGATSTTEEGLAEFVDLMQEQYRQIAGETYVGVQREPILFGRPNKHSARFLKQSCETGKIRYSRYANRGLTEWPDELQSE